MNATLTLKKDDLLKKLDARIQEIHDLFDVEVKNIQDVLDLRHKIKGTSAAHSDWYRQVAEGIADGSIQVTNNGKLKGAPPKPGTKSWIAEVSGVDKDTVDPNILARAKRYGYHDDVRLQGIIDLLRRNEGDHIKEVETAAEMVRMSTNETVEVNTADYQNLLSATLIGRSYY